MARTLTAAAATEAAKTTGAHIVRILEVQWPGGTVYYSTEALASPATTQARVLRWGERVVDGQPGKSSGQSTYTVELHDGDHDLKSRMESSPGIQNVHAYVHLFFVGTTWPTDRVTEFGGILTAPMQWNEQSAAWRITIRGFEHHFNRDIGFLLTRQDFPEVNCREVEGKIIPIVYGDPCYRVPATVIDRPGVGALAKTLKVTDTALTIAATAAEANFTTGSTIHLIVGTPTKWERITGSFANGSATTFSISSRGAIEASGTINQYGWEGRQYIALPKSAFSDFDNNDPKTPASRGGYPLYVQDDSGVWWTLMITHWRFHGSTVVVAPIGQLDVDFGNAFKVGSTPGTIPLWQPGTAIHEEGTWKYVCNFLPSKQVVRVEARTRVNVPDGDSQELYGELNAAYWTADTNDKTYNTALGRGASDPGLTTITTQVTPLQLGTEDETYWVTLKGIETVGDGTGTPITNPARIIEHLLTNEWLGNVSASFLDSATFTAAAAALSVKMAFALMDRKRLHDVASDLAHQGMCVYFWDQATAVIAKLSNTLSAGDSQLTITAANYRDRSIDIEEVDVKELTTQMLAKFQPAVPAPEVRFARKSQDAIDEYGLKRDELQLWAYQQNTHVAAVLEFWFTYRLKTQRLVSFETFLMGLKLRPGDTITLDIDDGAPAALFNSKLARIRSVKQQAADAQRGTMEALKVLAELNYYSFAIEAIVPSDDECDVGERRTAGKQEPVKLYVRSDGRNSMYIMLPESHSMPGGGALLHAPISGDINPSGNNFGLGKFFPVTEAGLGSGGIQKSICKFATAWQVDIDNPLNYGWSGSATAVNANDGDRLTTGSIEGNGVSQSSDAVRAKGFDFASDIPTGATIISVTVKWRTRSSNGFMSGTGNLLPWRDAGQAAPLKNDPNSFPTTEATSEVTWDNGEFSAAELRDSTFGVRLSNSLSASAGQFDTGDVDSVQVCVEWLE